MTDPSNLNVSLSGAGRTHVNTLQLAPETRHIVVAQGKQFSNVEPYCLLNIPDSYRQTGKERGDVVHVFGDGSTRTIRTMHPKVDSLKPLPLVHRSDGLWEYLNHQQGIRYLIELVHKKTDFVRALLTPGTIVMYSGHARYGRGPCFGSLNDAPGEEWEEGIGPHPNDTGIFRMGYPFISAHATEVLDYWYLARLVPASVPLPAKDCDPDLRGKLGQLKQKKIADINFLLPMRMRDPDLNQKYWCVGSGPDIEVVHFADWQNTYSVHDDIGEKTPLCKCFAHFGCSTYQHNYPVVRQLKQWTQSGDERYAYWTKAPADQMVAYYWLYHLLSFADYNAYEPLKASLDYALNQTNQLLAGDRDPCRII